MNKNTKFNMIYGNKRQPFNYGLLLLDSQIQNEFLNNFYVYINHLSEFDQFRCANFWNLMP